MLLWARECVLDRALELLHIQDRQVGEFADLCWNCSLKIVVVEHAATDALE